MLKRIEEGELFDMLLISRQGVFYIIWENLMVILMIVSSYYYAALAAFRGKESDLIHENMFEFVFLFDMLLTFNVDIMSKHKTTPVPIRDRQEIV